MYLNIAYLFPALHLLIHPMHCASIPVKSGQKPPQKIYLNVHFLPCFLFYIPGLLIINTSIAKFLTFNVLFRPLNSNFKKCEKIARFWGFLIFDSST